MIREGVMISDRYEIMTRIGTGGMADVYKAIDRKLNRYVAMKVLKREFREDENFVQKFQSEAQSAAGLLHPSIVNVYDVGEDRGVNYIVMELVDGITLKDYIQKKGHLKAKEVISIAVQVCAGIEAAHSNNIIHRDIKPQNIMISKEGKVKVTDFGIAKATSSNTISTNAMGSVHYTSPEQARGGFSDAKSDIYSLGITMYEMITGQLPFDGESTVSIALKHLQEEITPPSELVDKIPYSLERIILKCTQKSPDRRYANVTQLIRDLKRSMTEPDGDFVVIAPFVSAVETRMISPEELDTIKTTVASQSKQRVDLDEEFEYDDNYDYSDNEDEYEERRARRRNSSKKQIDPNMAKIMKILTIVVTVIFIFILIFVAGKALGLFDTFGPGIGKEQEHDTIPKVVGMPLEEARDLCADIGVEIDVVQIKKSEEYEEGIIIFQQTEEGTKVQPGGMKLQVIVSGGLTAGEIEVPNTKNMTPEKAKETLVNSGFDANKISTLPKWSDDVAEGKVIDTDPAAGTLASPEEDIWIVVSKGPEEVLVPRLVGKTKEDAMKLLSDREFKVKVEEVFDGAPEGEVLEQDIDPNEEVPKGTEITIKVSKGKEKVKIPTDLVGKSVNSVKATLGNLGLKVKESYQESTEYKEGIVVHVEGAGVETSKGSTVTIVISTGPGPSATPDPGPSTTPDPGTPDSGTGNETTTP